MSMELVNEVLVVDDSAVDRQLAGRLIEKQSNLSVGYAADGSEALASIRSHQPQIVVTDLLMPGMDGLALVQALRSERPRLPVVLMTGHGSETVASEALRAGAASYVPKCRLAQDLVPTLEKILGRAPTDSRPERLVDCIVYCDTAYELDNDPALAASLVEQIQQRLTRMQFCDDCSALQIGSALEAALLNAIYHGNLELPAQANALDRSALATQRRGEAPYRDRRIHLRARISRDELLFVVRDEGPGFDSASHLAMAQPALAGDHNRGLTLMQAFMDGVVFNEAGREVAMVKRRHATDEPPLARQSQ